jgi:hypothetical protein
VKKLAAVAAIGAIAVAVPAVAKPTNHPSHPTTSHKCVPHKVSYRASGKLVTWGLTKNANGTWSGTLTVHVTRTNHHAKPDKGKDVTYTVTDAKVRLGHGVSNPPVAGNRVELKGTVTTIAKKCNKPYFTPTVTITKIVVHTPAKGKH